MKNIKRTLSVVQCLALACVMSGVIHAQGILDIPMENYNFRNFVDTYLAPGVPMPQQYAAPRMQYQSFGNPIMNIPNENLQFRNSIDMLLR